MAAKFYDEMRALAFEMLDEFGMPMSVERLSAGAYVKVGSGKGAFVEDKQENESRTPSAILASTAIRNRTAVLSAAFKGVQANDRLVADKVTYTVKSVTTYRPTTTTIAYEVEVS